MPNTNAQAALLAAATFYAVTPADHAQASPADVRILAVEWKDWLDVQDKADRDAAVPTPPIAAPDPVPGSPIIPPEGIVTSLMEGQQ